MSDDLRAFLDGAYDTHAASPQAIAEALTAPVALAPRQREKAGGEPSERRLAAAGFADKSDDFAGMHGDVDVVDRVHDLLPHVGAQAIADLRREVERLDEALRGAAQFDQGR